jgi:hypothetical protein
VVTGSTGYRCSVAPSIPFDFVIKPLLMHHKDIRTLLRIFVGFDSGEVMNHELRTHDGNASRKERTKKIERRHLRGCLVILQGHRECLYSITLDNGETGRLSNVLKLFNARDSRCRCSLISRVGFCPDTCSGGAAGGTDHKRTVSSECPFLDSRFFSARLKNRHRL